MRISDWSSDVCSSDLAAIEQSRDSRRFAGDYRGTGDDDQHPGAGRGHQDDADDDHQRADDQPQRPEPRVPTLLLAMLVIAAETLARRRALQPIPACADLRDPSGEARLAMRSEEHTSE